MYIASITPYLLHIVKYLYFSFFCYKYMIETHKQNDSNKRKENDLSFGCQKIVKPT